MRFCTSEPITVSLAEYQKLLISDWLFRVLVHRKMNQLPQSLQICIDAHRQGDDDAFEAMRILGAVGVLLERNPELLLDPACSDAMETLIFSINSGNFKLFNQSKTVILDMSVWGDLFRDDPK